MFPTQTHTPLQKAIINPLEPCGVGLLFIMDGCSILGFKISTTIYCHYKAGKSQGIFNITLTVFIWNKMNIYT